MGADRITQETFLGNRPIYTKIANTDFLVELRLFFRGDISCSRERASRMLSQVGLTKRERERKEFPASRSGSESR